MVDKLHTTDPFVNLNSQAYMGINLVL